MPFSTWRWRQIMPVIAVLFAERSQAVEAIQQTYCSNQNTGMYSAETYNKYGSLDACQNVCKDDYAFAIIQGPDCWCSNYAPSNQQAIAVCDTTCPGWPYENCGSTTSNLFGYVALSNSVWGTVYPSTAAASTSAARKTSPAVAPSASPVKTTIILTSERVVVSTKAIVSTMAVVSTQVVSILVTPTPLPSSSSSTTTTTTTSSTSTSTSTSTWLSSSSGSSTSFTSALPTTSTSTSSIPGNTPLTTETTQNTVPATSLQAVTIYETLTVAEQITIISAITPTPTPTPTPTSLSTSIISSSASSSSATTTYVQYVTVSGAVITQYITPVASQAAESSTPAVFNQSHASHGLSGGAAAGIAIGALIGAALLGTLFFFCCWRKRNRNNDDESGLNRNTSVLSRVGLLRRTSDRHAEKANGRMPKLQTAGLAGQNMNENPMSATTAMTTTTSRDSRPMFVDQRLNPNAWGTIHPNASQSTLGSLHDHRDYSRPLEVRNPDNNVP